MNISKEGSKKLTPQRSAAQKTVEKERRRKSKLIGRVFNVITYYMMKKKRHFIFFCVLINFRKDEICRIQVHRECVARDHRFFRHKLQSRYFRDMGEIVANFPKNSRIFSLALSALQSQGRFLKKLKFSLNTSY